MFRMAYEINIIINEDNATAESIVSACNYVSEALDTMQIAHTIQCQKEGMILSKITKPLKSWKSRDYLAPKLEVDQVYADWIKER